MDCVAFLMDPERTIDSVISMFTGSQTAATKFPPVREGETESVASLRLRLHPYPSAVVSLVFAVDSIGINIGVWLLRKSKWSHDFLARWHSDLLLGWLVCVLRRFGWFVWLVGLVGWFCRFLVWLVGLVCGLVRWSGCSFWMWVGLVWSFLQLYQAV